MVYIHLILLFILYSFNSEVILKDSNTNVAIPSINLYQSNLLNSNIHQLIVVPELDSDTCEFSNSISDYKSTSRHYNYTSLLFTPTTQCKSYILPLSSVLKYQSLLLNKGYPILASILINPMVNDPRIVGSMSTQVYDPFTKFDNISYILLESNINSQQYNLKDLIYYDSRNLWNDNSNTNLSNLAWTITFKALKFILIFAQFILAGFVASRTKFKGRLQLGLLFVGILQLGGDWLISLLNGSYWASAYFSTIILLPAAIVNSLVVLSWTNIVYRLNTKVKIQPFRIATMTESVFINLLIIVRVILLISLNEVWYDNSISKNWHTILNYLIFILTCVAPLVMGIWFVTLAMKFCPIFHATAKLINAQWFTMFILMTRISFGLLLISDHLLKLMSLNPKQFKSFTILNDITLIAYNTMILLTVIKIQSISSVKQKWTPEQLGLHENQDGSITVNESVDTLEKEPVNPIVVNKEVTTNAPNTTNNTNSTNTTNTTNNYAFDYMRSVNSSTHSLSTS